MVSEQGGQRGRNRRFVVLVGLNVTYGALLVALAVLPRVPGAADIPDRITHGCAYGVQALLIFTMLAETWPIGRALVTSWLGTTVFGGLTEGLQMLQPSRSTELMDVIADASGAFAMCALIGVFHAVCGKRGLPG
jgi:VanZ family protein